MKSYALGALLTSVLVISAHAAEPVPLRVGWVTAMANAPAIIAERKGFFREEGLNVELKPFGDGPVI